MTALRAAAEDGPMNHVHPVLTRSGAESHSALGQPMNIDHPVLAQKTTMQAIVQDRYGSSSVLKLRSIDKPDIGADDALVRVRAAGVHVGDLHVMTGQPVPDAHRRLRPPRAQSSCPGYGCRGHGGSNRQQREAVSAGR